MKRKMPIKQFSRNNILLISCCCVVFSVVGIMHALGQPAVEKGFLPYRNYTTQQYNAMPQNWSVVQDNRGVIYVANNQGLLEYDGSTWREIDLLNEITVRSIAKDSAGKIYLGAKSELGYIAPNKAGRMTFYSMMDKIEEKDRDFSDVWITLCTPEGVYFQTSEKIFRWDGEKMKVWTPAESFHVSFYVNNRFYVKQKKIGLMQIIGDDIVLIQGGELFAEDAIYVMIPYGNEDQILISTRSKGLYIMTPTDRDYYPKDRITPEQYNKIVPFNTEIDDFLLKSLVYNASVLKDGNICLGTQGGGAVVVDKQGKLIQVINKNSGIQDETIYFQYLDNRDNLWLALGNGISSVEIATPLTFFNDKAGLEGTIQAITRYDDNLFVATNLGVYYLPDNTDEYVRKKTGITKYQPQFMPVKGISVECWDLLPFDKGKEKVLLVSTNTGVYEIKQDKTARLLIDMDAWPLFNSIQNPNRVFIGHTQGLSSIIWDESSGKWRHEDAIKDVEEGIFSISEDKHGNIWLSSFERSVYNIEILAYENNLIYDTKATKYNQSNGLPSDGEVKIFNTNEGKQILITAIGIMSFLPETGKFALDTIYGKQFADGIGSVYRIEEDVYNNVWMNSENNGIGFNKPSIKNGYEWVNTPFLRISDGFIFAIYHDKNGITWLGGANGLFRFDAKINKNYEHPYNTLIRKVTLGEDSVLFWGTNYDHNATVIVKQPDFLIPTLSYNFNSVAFEFAAQSYEGENTNRFSHFLQGFDKEWSGWKIKSEAIYTNLDEGTYYFRVKAKNIFNHESSEAMYEFTILPPWYRTIWAYGSYVLLFVGFVYGSIIVSTRKLQQIIKNKTSEIVKQKDEIEEKNKDITDSINYAQKIQQAILPANEEIKKHLPENFILFKPKDIVSGDFYWFSARDGRIYIAAADCTGHGVPGAFMSMIGSALLNEIVNEKRLTKPSEILQTLKEGIIQTLKQTGASGQQKDGMDIGFCAYDMAAKKVEYAGAYNPMYFIRNGEISIIKADRMPIGIYDDKGKTFTNNELDLKEGDILYTLTDGYEDQFGGPKGKKFMSKQFKELLLEIHTLSMDKQKEHLDKTIEDWKAFLDPDSHRYEQMDDILVIGVKIGSK